MYTVKLLFIVWIGVFSVGHATMPDNCIKAVIFDCDGTLINNGIGYFLDWQHAMKCQGYELNADEFWDFMNKNRLVGAPGADAAIVKYCCGLLGRDCSDEILKEKTVFSEKLHQTYEFPAIEPTVNFLRALGEEKENLGLKIGLASANTREPILRVLKRLNVDQYFDVIVSGDDLADYDDPEGTNKPKPYIYLEAAKLLGMQPKECVAIEDSRTGVLSAVRAGCITIAIPNIYTAHQDLSQAHIKLNTFEDVTPNNFLQIVDRCAIAIH